ncbi:hypothetical protein TNCV_3660001 [Trichonephila clavipes]|nr:hypothetical protein TNCV_3660001 [Trichonephila clavipes]
MGRHGTIPLRVKHDIEDVSSEFGNGDKGCTFLDETSRTLLLTDLIFLGSNKSSSKFMTTTKHVNLLKKLPGIKNCLEFQPIGILNVFYIFKVTESH